MVRMASTCRLKAAGSVRCRLGQPASGRLLLSNSPGRAYASCPTRPDPFPWTYSWRQTDRCRPGREAFGRSACRAAVAAGESLVSDICQRAPAPPSGSVAFSAIGGDAQPVPALRSPPELEDPENVMSASISRIETALGPLARSWGWPLAYGILCALVGLAVLFWPSEALRIFAILFAVQLIAASVFRFVLTFVRTGESFVRKLQMAALASFAFVAGIVLLGDVGLGLRLMTMVLGVYWAIHGAIELVEAISHRGPTDRVWVVASGTMGVVVGLILILAAAFPSSFPALPGSLLLVTRAVGVWLVVFGVIQVVRALRARSPQPASGKTSDLRPVT
jgi:uncharacterized membrane protein HdeD (DUF308 family)